jgi:hypothetical protein
MCRGPICIGQQIGKMPAGWSHTSCIVGARPLSDVLEQTRTIRAQRAASVRQAAIDDAEKATGDAEKAAKTAAIRASLRALVGEERFREIMERYA